ncbi:hypothetical protein N658DRAFT_393288, partial [Parathielavia hyrcaniae]
ELHSLLESTGKAILHNTQQLTSQLARQLEEGIQGVQNSLDALLQGKTPITFTGYFGPGPSSAPSHQVPAGQVPGLGQPSSPSPAEAPIITSLPKAFTVQDVWKQWAEGFAGQPAMQELEERWGARWRLGNAVKVQFCRRKVVWDTLLSRIAQGKSEEEAIAELEVLRAGKSLNQLADKLRQRQQRPRGR